MTSLCPACQTSNPDGALSCSKCKTPIDFPPNDGWQDSPTVDLDVSSDGASAAPQGNSGSLKPGDLLASRYEILALLGRGGMGTVYKANDREVGNIVAIKLINPELASRPDVVLRFKHELILARQITHKNVVRIFDLFLSENCKFITMQFVEGEDLNRLIETGGKLSVEKATAIFRQSLLGLAAAHEEGIIHRDLKPHNIMVGEHGHACLMDFGLASSVETAGVTRTGALMGTPDYMSPEQARGEKADARSDLFAMGVILFKMLTGQLPYPGANSIARLIARTRQPAPPVRGIDPLIPEQLAAIVARCLQMRPENRYGSAAEILADLDGHSAFATPRPTSPAFPGLPPGSGLGARYRIDSLLGEGAMGTVYKAWDNELGRPVALKLVRAELAGKPAYLEKLKKEILLASRISHRNILRTHDLGEADGIKFISMAYIDGCDLGEIVRAGGPLPIARAVSLATQLAQALAAAHAEGVVHRDLKPQNVLVSREDQAFITDFGIAVSMSGETGLQVGGTPQYMAPEQIEGDNADYRADIYAFGLILCEMVTGEMPFASTTMVQTMFQRVTKAPRHPKLLNPDLPDGVCAVILRCLEKEPACRYQSANQIVADLGNLEKYTALKPALAAPAARGPRRGPLWAAAAVLGIVAASAVPAIRSAILNRIWPRTAGAPDPARARYLAVLPLQTAGNDATLALVADGIVESLSGRLAQLRDVHLASASAAAAVNPQDPLAKIAQSLGAKLLLHGGVSESGGKIHIVLSLNEPASGRRLWTKEFSGLRQDILTIQDEIYNQLTAAMDVKLTSEDLARAAARPTDNIDAFSSYLAGRNQLRGKRNEQTLTAALGLFQKAAEQDPDFALAYTGIADASLALYEQKNDAIWISRALGAANRAEQINDRLPEIHFALGSVYSATGKTAEAIAELNRALELAPNSDEAYRRLGRAYRKAGRKDEAIQSLKKAVEANPYYWLNYNLLGIAWIEAGNNQEAEKAFLTVTKIDPARASGWSNLGSVAHNLGRWEESVAMYKRAADLQPSAVNYSNLGAGYYFLGRCDQARNDFEKANAINPDHANLGNLASAYRCLGQTQKAVTIYNQAISKALLDLQVNPKDASAISHLGVYYANVGNAARAMDFSRRAAQLAPGDANVLYEGAVVYAVLGDREKAIAALRQAVAKGASLKDALADPDLKAIAAAI